MSKIYLLTGLFFLSFTCLGQNIGAQEIEDTSAKPWVETDPKKYQGVYHFGENDGSNLILLITDSTITVQIRQSDYWIEGGYMVEAGTAKQSDLQIKWEFKNLSNLSIQNGRFYSDQYQGQFVTYTDEYARKFQGLKITNPWNTWIGKGRYEIGIKWQDFEIENWFPGKYPQASTQYLIINDLSSLSKASLKKMRNEIFARYGYKFEAGSDMDRYFKQKQWYVGRYKEVSAFLTSIELANINLIKTVEQTK